MLEHPFLGPTYQNTFLEADAQRCVNWFVNGNTLRSRLGHEVWSVAGNGPIRGWIEHRNELVIVSKNTVYSLSKGGATFSKGSIGTVSGEVWMASSGWDGDEVLIVDGDKGYVYNGSNTTLITDTGFPTKPHSCFFDNGYFGCFRGESARFYRADNAYDAVAWGGSFATAEQHPDRVLAALVNRNDLWFVGERSAEVWFYSGETFPWNPNRSAFHAYGIAAPNSLTHYDNNVAWLATSSEIGLLAIKTAGYAIERISNDVIERAWSKYTDISDAHSWSFQYPGLGHFLVYQFPTANRTWVYDGQEKQWHEWEMWDADPLAVGKPPGNRFANFGGKYLIPDDHNGNIYQMKEIYQDDGKHMVRKRMGPNVISNRNNITFSYLELVMKTGVGKTGNVTPQVRLSYSDDRGGEWANWRERSIGGPGARDIRVGFSRLGSARERIFKVEVSSDAEATLTNSVLLAEEGGL